MEQVVGQLMESMKAMQMEIHRMNEQRNMPQPSSSGTNPHDSDDSQSRGWSDLDSETQTPRQSSDLVSKMNQIPSRELIGRIVKNGKRYAGVPKTPIPTTSPSDKRLHSTQKKVEQTLNCVCDVLEDEDEASKHLLTLTALLVSIFDDLTELRRSNYTRGVSGVLEPSQTRDRLLSPEEERRFQAA